MSQAVLLLIAAIQLLTFVQTTPGISPEIKERAISLSNYAIEVATKATEKKPEEVKPVEPQEVTRDIPITEPTLLGGQSLNTPEKTVIKELKVLGTGGQCTTDSSLSTEVITVQVGDIEAHTQIIPGQGCMFIASYKEDGKFVSGVPILIRSSGNGRFSNDVMLSGTYNDKSGNAYFYYTPQ